MRKSYEAMKGKRLYNLHTGQFGRVVKVNPHGKTSARFVVKYENSRSKIEWEDTFGEVMKHNVFVPEEYRHVLPSHAERLRKIMALVDERCGGRVSVIQEHYTELDSFVRDEVHDRTVRDGFCLWKERVDSKFIMGISLWGSGLDLSLEASYKEVDKAGGNLWAVFRPKIERLIVDGVVSGK